MDELLVLATHAGSDDSWAVVVGGLGGTLVTFLFLWLVLNHG